MLQLFDDNASDSDVELETKNEYATKYDTWREKEELNKLKTKYGDSVRLNLEELDESSSSEDDEDGKHLTNEFEKDFFKTLAYLKRKDPKIYDEKVVFFEKKLEENEEAKNTKRKKQEPMFMKDYERKMILEKGAKFEESDEDEPEEDPRANSPTYVEEQKRIKESFKKAVDDDGDDEKWGGLFQKRQKTKEEQDEEEEDYKKWLKGNSEHLKNAEDETELKSLKDYWNKPDLDKEEVFLRDYLLNKRYLDKEDDDHIPTYEEIVHDSDENLSEDEKNIYKQEEFEQKYNFRYEEPDQEFIKRYPRSMDHSVRKSDDRRKIKREEIKNRKEEEKKQKQEELKQLKILKRKEIEEKIKKIKNITGNEQMAFQDNDIDGDFDPEEHDRRMQELFNNEYYEGEEGDQKPEFSDLEEELGPWKDQNELYCEDDNFNMDCDYDPTTAKKEKNKKEKKKRNRINKSKSEEAEKLPMDENDDKYSEYMDELYKLDYEDMIGDIPCRFKYREVVPNDFGLSVEEILIAKDKELNRWCSLKKTTQYRPEQAERYDVMAYKKKASNENLKKKCLPSLYDELEEELNEKNSKKHSTEKGTSDKKSKSKNKNNSSEHNKRESNKIMENTEMYIDRIAEIEQNEENENTENSNTDGYDKLEVKSKILKNKRHAINEENDNYMNEVKESNALVKITNEKTSKKKKKKHVNREANDIIEIAEETMVENADNNKSAEKVESPNSQKVKEPKIMSRRQKKNKKLSTNKVDDIQENAATEKRKRKLSEGTVNTTKKKRKFNNKNKNFRNVDKETKISDSRLEAYGINPKKYKNKLKYKNKV